MVLRAGLRPSSAQAPMAGTLPYVGSQLKAAWTASAKCCIVRLWPSCGLSVSQRVC